MSPLKLIICSCFLSDCVILRSPDKSEGGGASAAPTGEDTVDNGVQGGPEVNMDARRLKEHIEKEFQGELLSEQV